MGMAQDQPEPHRITEPGYSDRPTGLPAARDTHSPAIFNSESHNRFTG